jgi:hypothetical protein
VNVHLADTASKQCVVSDETPDFLIGCAVRCGKIVKGRENFFPSGKNAQSQLADNKRMRQDGPYIEKRRKCGVSSAQMIDPDGRIDQYH